MEFFHRKYIRWHGYNYDTAGYYFITIVTHERKNILSRIEDNQVHLSLIGKIVQKCMEQIEERFTDVQIEDFVLMPNHVHFIIKNYGEEDITEIVRTVKALSSFHYHRQNDNKKIKLWQRNYFDRVIRDEREFNFIRNYIFKNPERWNKDKLNNECITNNDNIMGTLKKIQLDSTYDPIDYFKR